MSALPLPDHVTLEQLKRQAELRLEKLRRIEPGATLAAARHALAQERGFSSWRALATDIGRREQALATTFFAACAAGDADKVRELLRASPHLAHTTDARAAHPGWTALHLAARQGQTSVVQALLEHGSDPNAREAGDNTTALHWAAAAGHRDTVRVLLDGGADVHGVGDVHALDTIGWASVYHSPGHAAGMEPARRELVSLLVERGARHHIFSAMAVGDPDLIRSVVAEDPDALDRRQSRFEHGRTPLHAAIAWKRYDLLDLLIELGAELEAVDARGDTALGMAMLRGDQEATRRLRAAGATPPTITPSAPLSSEMAALAGSVAKSVTMITVPDVARALDWYTSLGFTETARFAEDGLVNFGMVSFGRAALMLNLHGASGRHDASVWFYTDRVDDLYRALKARQLSLAQAEVGDATAAGGIEFVQQIEDMFYGARQFCIRDLNGYELYFIQSA